MRLPAYFACIFFFLAAGLSLQADWKENIGYDRLIETFPAGVPTAVAAGVTQVEAGTNQDNPANNYLPDSANTQFTGKTITNKSDGSGTSSHATTVGGYFYGNTNSVIPGTTAIDAYRGDDWTGSGFLQNPLGLPATESRLVQNHSWIANFDGTETAINASVEAFDKRLDYAVQQSGFIAVVGMNNGKTTTLPHLLAHAYNTISVGLTNGSHSAGYTAYDGDGRIKPDIVAPATATSYATPEVASVAGMLGQKLKDSYSLTGENIPRTVKALLLTGAIKESLPSTDTWANTGTRPLDVRYGAGELNALLAYRTLVAGEQTASTVATVADTGWANDSVRSSASKSYFFDVPAGSAHPRFAATLIWHRTITRIGFSLTASLANLDLQLYQANGFVRGESVAASASIVDNVEHIYQPDLAPGRYELVVSTDNSSAVSYALAWRTLPTVNIETTIAEADELTAAHARFTFIRTGSTISPLVVPLTIGGSAIPGEHYAPLPASITIPAAQSSAALDVVPVSDNLAQGDRSVTVQIADDYSLSAGASAAATVTIKDKPYDAWRFEHFSAEQLEDETVSGDAADPDSDGIPNLVEYALGGNPIEPDPTDITPQASITGDHLTLTYPATRAELTYTPEWSTDLQTWLSDTSHITETTENGLTTATANTPLSDAPRQFMRLQITRP